MDSGDVSYDPVPFSVEVWKPFYSKHFIPNEKSFSSGRFSFQAISRRDEKTVSDLVFDGLKVFYLDKKNGNENPEEWDPWNIPLKKTRRGSAPENNRITFRVSTEIAPIQPRNEDGSPFLDTWEVLYDVTVQVRFPSLAVYCKLFHRFFMIHYAEKCNVNGKTFERLQPVVTDYFSVTRTKEGIAGIRSIQVKSGEIEALPIRSVENPKKKRKLGSKSNSTEQEDEDSSSDESSSEEGNDDSEDESENTLEENSTETPHNGMQHFASEPSSQITLRNSNLYRVPNVTPGLIPPNPFDQDKDQQIVELKEKVFTLEKQVLHVVESLDHMKELFFNMSLPIGSQPDTNHQSTQSQWFNEWFNEPLPLFPPNSH